MKTIGGLGALREMYKKKATERLLSCVVSGRTENTSGASVRVRKENGEEMTIRVILHRNIKTGRTFIHPKYGALTILSIQRSKHNARVVGIWSDNPHTVITRTA